MGTIGDELRQAREAAGFSIEEVSARTKIRLSMIEAMELDDFGQLPAGLQGRGHLKAFAKEVRLDPDRLVRRFEREWATEPPPPEESPVDTDGRRFPVATLLTGAVLVAALTVLMQTSGGESEPPGADAVGTNGLAAAGTDSDGERSTPGSAVDPPKAPSSPPPPAPETLALELNPTATVWVEARADGQRVLYSLVRPGDRPVIEAKEEIVLRLGNAGALAYSINGMPGRPFGGPGEVRDIRITSADVPALTMGQ